MRPRHSTEPYRNLFESTLGAARGLYSAIKRERKIRQVFLSMCGAVILCAFADIGYFPMHMVIFSWLLALICEMINTAIEKACDYACGKEYHPLIRQGKDYAAASTFVALLFAISLTLFVLWKKTF